MQVKELHRKKAQTGETVVELEIGKMIVRLIGTYDKKKPLDELIYVMACRKMAQLRA
jgi:hypothetical protein